MVNWILRSTRGLDIGTEMDRAVLKTPYRRMHSFSRRQLRASCVAIGRKAREEAPDVKEPVWNLSRSLSATGESSPLIGEIGPPMRAAEPCNGQFRMLIGKSFFEGSPKRIVFL